MDWWLLFEIVLAGIGTGGLYALTGLAFVLIYKATRVVNIAIGEMLMMGAYIFFAFSAGMELPVWLAIPGALLGRSTIAKFDALCIPPSHNGIPVPIGALVRSLRASNTVTHVWTINDAAQAKRLWQKGVNGIISDDPASMLAERGR